MRRFKPLHQYLISHRKVLSGGAPCRKDDKVFLADSGEPLTMWGVAALFKKLKRLTGIDGKKVSAHQCRRYMATTQLANDRSPLDVRRQLGHSSLKMTDHYASLSIEQLQKSHEKYSPWFTDSDPGNNAFGSGYWDE